LKVFKDVYSVFDWEDHTQHADWSIIKHNGKLSKQKNMQQPLVAQIPENNKTQYKLSHDLLLLTKIKK